MKARTGQAWGARSLRRIVAKMGELLLACFASRWGTTVRRPVTRTGSHAGFSFVSRPLGLMARLLIPGVEDLCPKHLNSIFQLESSTSGSDQSKGSCDEFVQALSAFCSDVRDSWASAEDMGALEISIRTLECDSEWFPEYASALIFVGPKLGSFMRNVDQVWMIGLDNWVHRIHWREIAIFGCIVRL